MENQVNDTVVDEQGMDSIVDPTPNQEDIFDEVFNTISQNVQNKKTDDSYHILLFYT